jgi:hypothetical protein
MANGPRRLSFDIDGCRQHLKKMIRESERLEGTDDRIEKSDHAINAAMTGWHLHEWVWDEVKKIERSDPPTGDHLDPDAQQQLRLRLQLEQQKRKLAELRVEIGKELGIKAADVGKAEFGQFMAKRNPSIELCRIIATGSKHLDADDADDVEVETFVSATVPTILPLEEGSNTDSIQVIYTGVPKIRFGDIVTSSSDAFREAEKAWFEIIYSYKIDK